MNIFRSVIFILIATLLFGIIYPTLVTLISTYAFPAQASGSFITNASGKKIGSTLIAQPFTSARYFHPRPSVAGSKGYDAIDSASPTLPLFSPKFEKQLQNRATHYRTENHLFPFQSIQQDGVTTSASGLDPHITKQNALAQAERVAEARNLPLDSVKALIESQKERPFLFIFGKERVNVLLLNLALDDNLKRLQNQRNPD